MCSQVSRKHLLHLIAVGRGYGRSIQVLIERKGCFFYEVKNILSGLSHSSTYDADSFGKALSSEVACSIVFLT